MAFQDPIDQIAAAKSAQKPGTRIDFIDHDDKAMLRAAREATRDLGTARAGIYWSDMLGSAALGYATLAVAILAQSPWLMLGAGLVSALAFYRALLFIHEQTGRANA